MSARSGVMPLVGNSTAVTHFYRWRLEDVTQVEEVGDDGERRVSAPCVHTEVLSRDRDVETFKDLGGVGNDIACFLIDGLELFAMTIKQSRVG